MPTKQSNTQLDVKLFQRSKTKDLNVLLLQTFHQMKFEDKFETVLGKEELFSKSNAVQFEKTFISECFYCGCINNESSVKISYLIIRKVSLIELCMQFKKQFRNRNMLKQAIVILLKALLNGLQPNEHILVYDDDDNRFIKLSQSITDERIRQYIESFKMFDFFYWLLQNDGSSKKSVTLNILYDTLKKTEIGKNASIKFFYTLIDNNCPAFSPENYDIIFCKKEHRKTYTICKTTSFLQKIKGTAPKNYIFFKKMYNFAGIQ